MADVYTVLFISLGILISFPALLIALNLLFPTVTAGVQMRLTETPGKSFLLGVPVLCAFALWVAVTGAGAGPVRMLAYVGGVVGMGIGVIGAAGVARLLGMRLGQLGSDQTTAVSPPHPTALLRGAVVFELACLFPGVGWFLFLPLATVGMVGAAVFALLRSVPRRDVVLAPAITVEPMEVS